MKEAHVAGAYNDLHARLGSEAQAKDGALEVEGSAGVVKVNRRKRDRVRSGDYRKKKKAKADDLVQDEARLMKRGAALLVQLELDDDGAGGLIDTPAFPEDEKAIKALVAAKESEQDKKKRKALGMRETRARQALAHKVLQRRVALLEIRVAALEEAAAPSKKRTPAVKAIAAPSKKRTKKRTPAVEAIAAPSKKHLAALVALLPTAAWPEPAAPA